MKKTRYNVGFAAIALFLLLLLFGGTQAVFAASNPGSLTGYGQTAAVLSDSRNTSKIASQAMEQAVSNYAEEDNDIHDVDIIFCTDRVMLKDKHGEVKRDKQGFIRFGCEVTPDEPLWGVATFHKDKAFKNGRAVQQAFSVNNLLMSKWKLHMPQRTAEKIFKTTEEAKQYLAKAVHDSGQPDVVAFFPGCDGTHEFYEAECSAWKFHKSRIDRHKRVYVVFDYASRGHKPGLITYMHDRRIVTASEGDAEGMVELIAQVVGRDHIVFKAHSMGGILAVRVARYFDDVDSGIRKIDPLAHIVQFKEMDLIFADVDLLAYKKVFAPAMTRLFKFPPEVGRSAIDMLMELSHIANGKVRVGEHRNAGVNDDIPGHTIWDFTKADCPWIGHAIFFLASEDLEEDGDPPTGWCKVLLRDENGCKHYKLERVHK